MQSKQQMAGEVKRGRIEKVWIGVLEKETTLAFGLCPRGIAAARALTRSLAQGQMSFLREPARIEANWQYSTLRRFIVCSLAARTSVPEHLPSWPTKEVS